ncbi:Si-specific NAD(P)(+) transhydrogenase [Candidatus Similichlamydia laticola]|uniref:Soluble pyridine nucleotide transhydrogenase n=1 Tax=Candidatus Similichlamydia laticola TaxID=2170265 RepID=A0A369KC07_9BACT|nr:Si-specific NAD(P)(+) transhydrogenase [Candidatus Similichlamydia laticola]RDB31448.1 Soluble pyridine nucleotide transhydrogenase [Candidatus Similichlamydia laticola]
MVETTEVDLLVIGSGPAGQRAAFQGAKLGKKVLVVEAGEYIGGGCLNSGTIPSKAMRQAIVTLTRCNERKFADSWINPELSLFAVKSRMEHIQKEQRETLRDQFHRNQIFFVHGFARFKDPYTMEILNKGRVTIQVKASYIVLATGSVPRNPMEVPFDGERLLDSTAFLDLKSLPKRLVVLGAGIVGTEYASFFTVLGVSVLLLDKKDVLLGFLDREIREVFSLELQRLGLEFIGEKCPEKIERFENEVQVKCTDGSVYSGDVLLYALGRVANTKGLCLEKVGVEVCEEGFVKVDKYFRTSLSHVYAVGDVVGSPALAAASFEQGRLAAQHMFGTESCAFPEVFPVGIYTIPEISFVGESEVSLREKDIDFVSGHARFCELARGEIETNEMGLLKMLICKKTRKIMGVHIVGRRATELVHLGQIAIHFNATVDFFADRIFNYPTYSEAYIVAALDAVNKLAPLAL